MKKVVTVCPYCASGCKINLVVDNGKIVRAEAAQGKTNQGTLCLKGYYGWDFINDTQILTPRLKTPMIRRQRGGKRAPLLVPITSTAALASDTALRLQVCTSRSVTAP